MRLVTLLLLSFALLIPQRADAKPIAGGVAIWRIAPLGGLSPEIVRRLESLLTLEMGRIVGAIVPPIQSQLMQRRYRRLRKCQGENYCLARLAKRLRVRYIIAGTIAELGGDYVATMKMVDAWNGKVERNVTEQLSGKEELLIETVRVAAYRLLDPSKLTGSVQVLVNVPGAKVFIDGKMRGKTPLKSSISGLKVAEHALRITHPDYLDYVKKIKVRFQKQVLVDVDLRKPAVVMPRLGLPPKPVPPVVMDRPTPFYAKWWFWTIVGVVAVGAGVAVGLAVPQRVFHPRLCDNFGCN